MPYKVLPLTQGATVIDDYGRSYGLFPTIEMAEATVSMLEDGELRSRKPPPEDPLLRAHYERYIKPNESLSTNNTNQG